MQKLNQQGTRIFCKLIAMLNNDDNKKFLSEGFMPLSMECISEQIETPSGIGKLYSLFHFYEQNGHLMRDPEMCFVVVDNRTDVRDFEAVAIYPQLFRQDNLNIYEESIRIQHGRLISCINARQKGHCNFANMWLRNIRQQNFLK